MRTTLNVNSPNNPIKEQKLSDGGKKLQGHHTSLEQQKELL